GQYSETVDYTLAWMAGTSPATTVRKALAARHPPDDVAGVVGDEQRLVRPDADADRAAVGERLIGRQEAGEDVARRPGRPAGLERHVHDAIAGERAAVPRAMLADDHAIAEARQRVRRHPAQAERGGMAAEGEIRLQRLGDHRRIGRHALVDDAVPVAIRPAVEAAFRDAGQVIRRRLVAESVALVDDGPQAAACRLEGEADRVAQAAGENLASPRGDVVAMDRRAALLGGEAVVGDIGLRADADINRSGVRARQQAARPMPAGLERCELAAKALELRRAGLEREGDQRVGIADIEGVANHRHAERLVEAV